MSEKGFLVSSESASPNVKFDSLHDKTNYIRALTFHDDSVNPVETFVQVIRIRKRKQHNRTTATVGSGK